MNQIYFDRKFMNKLLEIKYIKIMNNSLKIIIMNQIYFDRKFMNKLLEMKYIKINKIQ